MRGSYVLLGTFALAVVGGILYSTLSRPEGGTARRAAGPSEDGPVAVQDRASEPAPHGVADAGTEPVTATPTPQPAQERRSAAPALLVEVLSTAGEPIDGAQVSWQKLVPLENALAWWSGPPAERLGARATTTRGAAAFLDPPAFEGEGVVVATHPDHTASAGRVPTGADRIVLRLEPSPAAVVEVVGAAGGPAGGVRVETRGRLAVEGATIRIDRTYETGDDGRIRVDPLPDVSRATATDADGLSSAPWHGRHAELDGPIVLELVPLLAAYGAITGAPSPEALGACTVTARSPDAEHDEPLAHAIPSGTGDWSLDVPWQGAGEYLFRLEGPELVTLEKILTVADPDDRPRVDFEWSTGTLVECLVVDAAGEAPLPGVEVVAIWDRDDRWVKTSTESGEDGLARLPHVPDGHTWVRTYASGYVDRLHGPYLIPVEAGAPLKLAIFEAGRLHGHVSHQGEPAQDFAVTFWADEPGQHVTEEFTGSPEGHFELEKVPLGRISLFAASAEHPRGPTVVATVESGSSVEVELELGSTRLASGRVIDAVRGRPLEGAEVQALRAVGHVPADPEGPAIRAGAGGRFADLPVSAAGSIVRASHEGYAAATTPTPAGEGPVDLGVLSLSPPQDLTVRLVTRSGADLTEYSVGMEQYREPIDSPADGVVVFEDVEAGPRRVTVFPPRYGKTDVDLHLAPGDPWEVDVLVDSGRIVNARVEADDSIELPERTWVAAFTGEEAPHPGEYALMAEDGVATFHGLEGTRVQFAVFTPESDILATVWRDLPVEGDADVVLPVRSTRRRLVCRDAADEPIVGAFVVLHAATGVGSDYRDRTDAEGALELRGFEAPEVLLRAKLPGGGYAAARRVTLAPEGTTPVRIVTDGSVQAVLMDGDLPLVGVPVTILDPADGLDAVSATSGAEGLLELRSLTPGPYDLRIDGSGTWRSVYAVEATADPVPVTLQVRRTGELLVEVTSGGLPVLGAQVTLVSDELGETVGQWIAEGRAHAEGDGTTDAKGRIRLSGLPHGTYRWKIELGAASAEGTCTVRPHAETLARLELGG